MANFGVGHRIMNYSYSYTQSCQGIQINMEKLCGCFVITQTMLIIHFLTFLLSFSDPC